MSYSNSDKRCGRFRKDYIWLYSMVKDDALFDVKKEKSWDSFMAKINAHVQFYQSGFMFIYDDEIINAEKLGNILYGFSGNAGGYSLNELRIGGSIYSYLGTTEFDDEEDRDKIKEGYILYNNYKYDYEYLHKVKNEGKEK